MTRVVLAALFTMLSVGNASAPTDRVCLTGDERERARAIMFDAFDQGLKEYTTRQFDVMVKDPINQPARAIAGMKPALVAYAKGRRAIAIWNPVSCEQ